MATKTVAPKRAPSSKVKKDPAPSKRKRPVKNVATKRPRATADIDLMLNIVLDMSGSMSGIQMDTIEAVNQYIEDQRKHPGKTWVSLMQFDTVYEPIYVGTPIEEVQPLTAAIYKPRGYTALYDAIGKSIEDVERLLAKSNEVQPDKVLTVIFTDGMENASREFDRATIQARIKTKQADGWDFSYMGANHDPFAVAQAIGVHRSYTQSFAGSGTGVRQSTASASLSTSRYRGAVAQNLASGVDVAQASPTSFYDSESAEDTT